MGNDNAERYTVIPMFDVPRDYAGPETFTGTVTECWDYIASFGERGPYIGRLSRVLHGPRTGDIVQDSRGEKREQDSQNLYELEAHYEPTEVQWELYSQIEDAYYDELEADPDASPNHNALCELSGHVTLYFVMVPEHTVVGWWSGNTSLWARGVRACIRETSAWLWRDVKTQDQWGRYSPPTGPT